MGSPSLKLVHSESSARARRRARRTRSPHPGVVLIPPEPDGRHPSWRARVDDPDTGRKRKVTLEAPAARTAETRRTWAIATSKAIARRRIELEMGAVRATGTRLDDAIDRYFTDHPQLRDKTRAAYSASAAKLKAWAAREGVRSTDDLTKGRLVAFRAAVVKERKQIAKKGGRRGERKAATRPRSAYSVNRDLAGARTILGYLCELELLPHVDEGALARSLRKLPVNTEQPAYLASAELRVLLSAAIAHDKAVFAETRAEHAGQGESGTTPRHPSIAPLVVVTLLTGMRAGEVMDLDWAAIDLDAHGDDGASAGAIRLTAATKTRRARTVWLDVSPSVRAILALMRGDRTRPRGPVWRFTRIEAESAFKRLATRYGAPEVAGFQLLRSTCGTYATNAPGVYGGASAYQSARRLGHSVSVAEKHYVGLVRGIPQGARTLEAAMGVEAEVARVVAVLRRAKTSS